ncbi:MAG TPA: ferritin family protein, partial [Tepidisphaeraceae bacterium]|nr:ferritin family protein [Tepidisphaeraceae bacterium]
MRSFKSLTEQEILALAISSEEDDVHVYSDFAEGLRENFPATATIFTRMREEESRHRHRLIELYRKKFGEHIPLIRREDVRGFVKYKPVWLLRPLRLETVRKQAAVMEAETRRFYETAAKQTSDASVRQLLGDLAEDERGHEVLAEHMAEKN